MDTDLCKANTTVNLSEYLPRSRTPIRSSRRKNIVLNLASNQLTTETKLRKRIQFSASIHGSEPKRFSKCLKWPLIRSRYSTTWIICRCWPIQKGILHSADYWTTVNSFGQAARNCADFRVLLSRNDERYLKFFGHTVPGSNRNFKSNIRFMPSSSCLGSTRKNCHLRFPPVHFRKNCSLIKTNRFSSFVGQPLFFVKAPSETGKPSARYAENGSLIAAQRMVSVR